MKEGWKNWYLGFLIVISLVYIILRWGIIESGSATTLDISIGIIFLVLILSPLFNEIKLFGFSFKTELKELKNDIRHEIISLRSEINNSINFSPKIDLNSSELTKQEVEKLIKSHKESELDAEEKYLEEFPISDKILKLFRIRYALESKMVEVGKKINSQYPHLNENFRPPTRVTLYLQQDGHIDRHLANAIRHVYNSTSRAIHGEELHEVTLENIKELAPILIEELDDILEEAYP